MAHIERTCATVFDSDLALPYLLNNQVQCTWMQRHFVCYNFVKTCNISVFCC